MKISNVTIKNFRGIKEANILFPNHAVLIGDNNTGKTSVLEALNLVLGPDRLNKRPVIDEHDFYGGEYFNSENPEESPKIEIEVIITNLNDEQKCHFCANIEFWCNEKQALYETPPPESLDKEAIVPALRVHFIGNYDLEEDDFEGNTFFSHPLSQNEQQPLFKKKDKQKIGFLYMRTTRTGTRALSLEKGSLLDIILRIKEIRPQMWENIINPLSDFKVAEDPSVGISDMLESIEKAIKKYVPREWGVNPHLKISKLTREHLREIITAFISTGERDYSAPFYRQGTGTINILVLAMLSQIAEDRQTIFAMEEPEISVPPYTQKQIIHQIKKLSTQSIFTSHSPYVLEEFTLEETVVLHRDNNGDLTRANIELPKSIKPKYYRQNFRKNFCEGLLSRRILIVEGATEAAAIPAVAKRLSELKPDLYFPLEALGICVIDAEGQGKIADIANLYANLKKEVFALCDKQEESEKDKIQKTVKQLFMHEEKGFEDLVLNDTKNEAIARFVKDKDTECPSYLSQKPCLDATNGKEALKEYFFQTKGNRSVADFLIQCEEEEIPKWIKDTCATLKELCDSTASSDVITDGDDSDTSAQEENNIV